MPQAQWTTAKAEIEALVAGLHADPFRLLGLHRVGETWIARAFVPDAKTCEVSTLDGTLAGPLPRVNDAGFFEGPVKLVGQQPVRLTCSNANATWSLVDPYSFGPVLGHLDDYYFFEGTHLRLYERMGAHPMVLEGVEGVHFAVWAPNARRVAVVGDFNFWDGRRGLMRHRESAGLWEYFSPQARPGDSYKFEVAGPDGRVLPMKADPFGTGSEMRPATASRIVRTDDFTWTDQAWLSSRTTANARRRPVSIYEVHAGSWQRTEGNGFLTWTELGDRLIPYAKEMGFTHLEFMPVNEHPLDASWGYQPIGLFAPTARFGSPAEFASFIDRAHGANLGIILDWVPAHFPVDPHGLTLFDGTHLYDHVDPREGFHPDWNTAIYNFGRREVQAFLVNNALFWFGRYHVDALRVDAVASMLYRDYSRQEGEWVPNILGGRENLEAIEFLRRTNGEAYGHFPGIMMIAEESTAFPGVSAPVDAGGLGFGFKWNMGFMNDTLRYLQRDPVHRKFAHSEITFAAIYAWSENFVLPLSHDEVVHGKGTLLTKMAGHDDWQKFATLRAYYAFMWGFPGKKLLFMGQEWAQRDEWSEDRSLDWHLLKHEPHRAVQTLVRDLNGHYSSLPALYARDCEPEGFDWLIADDADNSIFAFLRRSGGTEPDVAIVTNFTPVTRENYLLPLPKAGTWRELLNTDAREYWGSGVGNSGSVHAVPVAANGKPAGAWITVPPLATLYLLAPE